MKTLAVVAALVAVANAHGFDEAVTPRDIFVMFGDWGLNYNGLSNQPAADKVHADIKAAIAMSPNFDSFCNGPDKDTNKREAASFFATVRKETGGMSTFEEKVSDPNQYCTSSSVSGASAELKEAGLKYPCAPGNKGYHGRGAIQLTWNINYGRFSEFMYGDKNKLLNNPELVVGDGPLGWAATLWFWMTSQDYGGQCPPKQLNGYLTPGHLSCHDAMHTGKGMGMTINIINGGYECCSTSPYRSSPIARVQSYMTFLGILGAAKAHHDCAPGNFNSCQFSAGCPIISERGGNGFPVLGTCTSASTSRWLGSEQVFVDSWTCATTDPGPGGVTTTKPPTTTVPPPTTTVPPPPPTTTVPPPPPTTTVPPPPPTTTVPPPPPTTTVAPPPTTAAPPPTGGCKSLQAHISDAWCVSVGCEVSYPSICART